MDFYNSSHETFVLSFCSVVRHRILKKQIEMKMKCDLLEDIEKNKNEENRYPK